MSYDELYDKSKVVCDFNRVLLSEKKILSSETWWKVSLNGQNFQRLSEAMFVEYIL